MNSIENLMRDELRAAESAPLPRVPLTWKEALQSGWTGANLDTLTGSHEPYREAFTELQDRLRSVAGQDPAEIARARNLPWDELGQYSRAQTMGQIIDSLPDSQQKLLADYRDVNARARQKAALRKRENAERDNATWGITANAMSILGGIGRQMVDPVNVMLAPVGPGRLAAGAGSRAIGLFLAKEAGAGALVQAVQEPIIARNREAVGLESNSWENIIEAGTGQAAFSGTLMAAGAALRALRRSGKKVPPPLENIEPEDFEAAGRQAQRDAVMDRYAGDPVRGHEAIEQARAALETGKPIEGISAARAAQFDLSQPRPIRVSDDLTLTVRYQLMDLADLKISHSMDGAANDAYPQALQPRDRSEAASLQWVRQEASRLDPEQLGPASTPQQGAPIVAADGVVESGNGRALLLAEAYERLPDRAQAYRDYLDDLGFDTSQMERPVLVRVRETDLSPEQRIAFTREANVTATATLSPAARAKVDAGKIDDGLMALWGGTEQIDTAANAKFNRAFAAKAVARTELPDFIRADGSLTEISARRIKAALVARAWGEDDLIAKTVDDASGTSKMIVQALVDTAPLASRLRAAVGEGRLPRDMDVGADIVAGFRLVEQARKSGQKVSVLVDQVDLERGAVPQGVRDAVAMFFRDEDFTIAADAKTIKSRIEFAIENALLRQHEDLFGETASAAGLLRAARLVDTSIDETDLPDLKGPKRRTLDEQKKMTEAAQATPERLTPAALPAEFTAIERQIAATLGDVPPDARVFDIGRTDADGEMTPGSARQLMDEHRARVQAAAELQDCVARTGGTAAA